jgi:hypothetical protein
MQEVAVIIDGMGYKKSADTIDRFRFDLWNYKSFPRSHWRKIRTTNGLERINKELKRRSRVSGVHFYDQSLLRVAVCIMMDIHEDWITGNKYLILEERIKSGYRAPAILQQTRHATVMSVRDGKIRVYLEQNVSIFQSQRINAPLRYLAKCNQHQ